MRALLISLLALLAGPALAADPECSDPNIVWPPGQVYDATDGYLEFCSPVRQPNGDPIPEGLVTSCAVDIDADGTIDRTVSVERTGQYFNLNFTNQDYTGEHTVNITCVLADGRTNAPYQFIADFCQAPPEEPIEVDTVYLVKVPAA